MDNVTLDLMNLARDRAGQAIRDAAALADTKEQAFHIALAGVTGALGNAAGAFAQWRGIPLEEVDAVAIAENILQMMKEAAND